MSFLSFFSQYNPPDMYWLWIIFFYKSKISNFATNYVGIEKPHNCMDLSAKPVFRVRTFKNVDLDPTPFMLGSIFILD